MRRASDRSPRSLAANVDVVFVVASLNQDLNLRRLERYLALAWESGAQPVVVLSKADLGEDLEATLADVESVAVGVPIIVVSAIDGRGIDELRAHITPGATVAFVGSSGVGKSTLVNTLAGDEVAAVREIREDDARGRHTTSRRQLHRMPDGGLVLDTPGMRELGLWDADAGLERSFADIDALARDLPVLGLRPCRRARLRRCGGDRRRRSRCEPVRGLEEARARGAAPRAARRPSRPRGGTPPLADDQQVRREAHGSEVREGAVGDADEHQGRHDGPAPGRPADRRAALPPVRHGPRRRAARRPHRRGGPRRPGQLLAVGRRPSERAGAPAWPIRPGTGHARRRGRRQARRRHDSERPRPRGRRPAPDRRLGSAGAASPRHRAGAAPLDGGSLARGRRRMGRLGTARHHQVGQ